MPKKSELIVAQLSIVDKYETYTCNVARKLQKIHAKQFFNKFFNFYFDDFMIFY